MKKVKRELIVLIPVGPGTNSYFLKDTIKSIRHYCTKSHEIILINDSQRELSHSILLLNIVEIKTPKSMGKQSGLYFSLCLGLRYAIENFDFQILIRMDDDALITGFKPEKDAKDYFIEHDEVALLGSHRETWNNELRDFSPPKKQIIKETSLLWPIITFIRQKPANSYRKILKTALRNGYELGEHVLGGAYFMSYAFIKQLDENNFLPAKEFNGSNLEEDHIFGILAFACKMKLADFVTGTHPMCLKWRGMPTHPSEIIKLRKKVIHSTRFYQKLDENSVRLYFKRHRTNELHEFN